MKSRNYLIFRLSAMGDVALTVPVLRAVVESNPDVQFTVVTNRFFAPFFYGVENCNLFHPDLKGRHKGIFGLIRLSKDLRAIANWDGVIDIHDVLRTKIVSKLLKFRGVPIFTIDKGREEKRAILSTKESSTYLKHTTDRYIDTFKQSGLSISESVNGVIGELGSRYIESSVESQKGVENYIESSFGSIVPESVTKEELSIQVGDEIIYVGIAPYAMHDPKMWGVDKIEDLLEIVSRERRNWRVSLFGGGAKEKSQLEKLSSKFDNVESVVGKLSFSEEISLISSLDVMLSMDSGNMHIASLCGTPTISVWGGTHPCFGFSALGQPEENSLQIAEGSLSCRPCSIFGGKACSKLSKICMNRISVDRVLNSMDRVILERI